MREARAGDRYLLCSDGLSDPVSQETILEALRLPDVAESADRLIELALRGGGPDNVTVVVADVVDYDYGQTQPILAGAVSGDDVALAPPNTSAGRASAINPRRTEAAKRIVAEEDTPPKRKRSWQRIAIAAAVVVVLIAAALVVGWKLIRSNYYVAASDGTVLIMRGVSGSLLGIPLQSKHLVGCVNDRNELSLINVGQQPNGCRLLRLGDLKDAGRTQVTNGLPTGSFDKANEQLHKLVAQYLMAVCGQSPPAQPAPAQPAPATPPTTETTEPAPSSTAGPPPLTSIEPSPSQGPGSASTTAPPTTASSQPQPSAPAKQPQPGVDCRTAA